MMRRILLLVSMIACTACGETTKTATTRDAGWGDTRFAVDSGPADGRTSVVDMGAGPPDSAATDTRDTALPNTPDTALSVTPDTARDTKLPNTLDAARDTALADTRDTGRADASTDSRDAGQPDLPLDTSLVDAPRDTQTPDQLASDAEVPPAQLPRLEIANLEYIGAFGIPADYTDGTIGYNPTRHSLFIAGHAQENSVGEFAIPELLVRSKAADLNWSETPLQPFADMVDRPPEGNPEEHNRIDGLLVHNGQLIVNTENWYDAGGTNRDTTLVVRDAANLAGTIDGYFEMEGRVHAGGYMSPIPAEWQSVLGGTHVTGWSSVTSIISRHSIGPSLFTFNPTDITGSPLGSRSSVTTKRWMDFPHEGQHYLGSDALTVQQGSAPALWNFLSGASYAFIVPGTRTFAAFGRSGGVDTGIGYKLQTPDYPDGACGGYCPYSKDDNYNYYWLFDIMDIVTAANPWDPRPYAYGRWPQPFDGNGQFTISGGTFDPAGKILYLSLGPGAGQRDTYDRPPVILAYRISL